jgi:type II secretory pathway pseudopilin PulG
MQSSFTSLRNQQTGFSILEVMLATVILLVGLVAIAQLVPASILLNYRNRNDSSAMVFAQREMDLMVDQPLVSNSFTDPTGLYCAPAATCNLGDPTQPNQIVGSPVLVIQNQTFINFGAAPVANYSFTFQDPTDPSGNAYDVRWTVIITGNGTTASSKRFIVGVQQQAANGFFLPVTLDTMVGK